MSAQEYDVMNRKTPRAVQRAADSKTPQSALSSTPRGSRNKFKYEPANKMYSSSKILPEGMVFPYDFGFVPGTRADDGTRWRYTRGICWRFTAQDNC